VQPVKITIDAERYDRMIMQIDIAAVEAARRHRPLVNA
jgi:hypothetical protein